jgi:long-chain fatty acid transport protein
VNRQPWINLLPAVAFVAWTPTLWGSAFAINELGTRAQGMGGAFTAIADDGSALFFNPAGIAFQKGWQFQMDNMAVIGQFRFIPSDPPPGQQIPEKGFHGSVKPKFIPVASMYMTKDLTKRWSFGFAGYSPFGLASNFTNFNDGDPPNTKYPGRFAGTRAKLLSLWMQPTFAFKLTENSAIAGGIAFVHTYIFLEQSILNPYDVDSPNQLSLDLARAVFPGQDPRLAYRSFARLLPEGRLRAAATANSPGFSLGWLHKVPDKKFQVGLMWRSAVVNHLRGKASFAFNRDGALLPFLPSDRGLDVLFPNQDIGGNFVTPGTFVAGVSTTAIPKTTLAFDARLQDFRRFVDFPINFTKNVDAKGRPTATEAEQRLNFNFRNSILLHAGMERQLNERTWIRAGYAYDRSPVVDESVGPLFPDNNRHNFTVGATRRVGSVEFSMFYQAMQMVNRTVNVPANRNDFTNGDYNNFVHLAGAGLRIVMGKPK